MKLFNQWLAEINDGRQNLEASAELERVLASIRDTGKAGEVTVSIRIKPHGAGIPADKVTTVVRVTSKVPKLPAADDFFWLTDGAEPTRQHPKQQELRFVGDIETTEPKEQNAN